MRCGGQGQTLPILSIPVTAFATPCSVLNRMSFKPRLAASFHHALQTCEGGSSPSPSSAIALSVDHDNSTNKLPRSPSLPLQLAWILNCAAVFFSIKQRWTNSACGILPHRGRKTIADRYDYHHPALPLPWLLSHGCPSRSSRRTLLLWHSSSLSRHFLPPLYYVGLTAYVLHTPAALPYKAISTRCI